MPHLLVLRLLVAACALGQAAHAAQAADAFPTEIATSMRAAGLPASSFGFYALPVERREAVPLASLNAEHAFLLASTTKIVTSLAALDLLGPEHRWRTEAFASGPVTRGRLNGDLVVVGAGNGGLTPAELRRWFQQMRTEGLTDIGGRIVLERFALLHEHEPEQVATTAAERANGTTPDARTFNRGALVVAVQPGGGRLAGVALKPHPPGVAVSNDVAMGGGCQAWARWAPAAAGAAPRLLVGGRWDKHCGRRDIAFVRLPPSYRPTPQALAAVSTPRLVAGLWAEVGGRLRGGVVETDRALSRHDAARVAPPWTSRMSTMLPDVIREINKTSNNVAARSLLLSLAAGVPLMPDGSASLSGAQLRMKAWLLSRGLDDSDIHVDQGSGQSRDERGKPRAMVQLLRQAWRSTDAKVFVDSLPIAGVDGTLAHRLRNGSATGQAYLKTGTLRDPRALAGYVRSRSGKVYAVAALVNHAEAARAVPVLDAFIEWVARNG